MCSPCARRSPAAVVGVPRTSSHGLSGLAGRPVTAPHAPTFVLTPHPPGVSLPCGVVSDGGRHTSCSGASAEPPILSRLCSSVWPTMPWSAHEPSMPTLCRCSPARRVCGCEPPTLRRTMAPGTWGAGYPACSCTSSSRRGGAPRGGASAWPGTWQLELPLRLLWRQGYHCGVVVALRRRGASAKGAPAAEPGGSWVLGLGPESGSCQLWLRQCGRGGIWAQAGMVFIYICWLWVGVGFCALRRSLTISSNCAL